jgi:hypothetical protein
MKKMAQRKIGAQLRHSIVSLSQSLHHASRTLSRQLVGELRRLNSARMGRSELLRLEPSARARAVKAALVEHHEGRPRCC